VRFAPVFNPARSESSSSAPAGNRVRGSGDIASGVQGPQQGSEPWQGGAVQLAGGRVLQSWHKAHLTGPLVGRKPIMQIDKQGGIWRRRLIGH
jgi:hypothetical protein